jgi:Tol biopolymer transport system component
MNRHYIKLLPIIMLIIMTGLSACKTNNPTTTATATGTPTSSKPAETPTATAPRTHWKIAFVSEGNMYTMENDGTKKTKVPNYDASCSSPSWTADGSRTAFVQGGDLYTMNIDGSKKTKVTNHGSGCSGPSWSPDGSRIAFIFNLIPYVIKADGSGEHPLTEDIGMDDWRPEIAWSPDNSTVAFSTPFTLDNVKHYYICVAKADGTSFKIVSPKDKDYWYPAWSPDSTRVSFSSSDGGIFTVKADGLDLRTIIDTSTVTKSTGGRGGHLAWSPDGSSIVYGGMSYGASNENLFVVDVNSSVEKQLTEYDSTEMIPGYYYPRWYPDGLKIISLFGNVLGDYDVYVMNADGSDQVKLANVVFDVLGIVWPD